MKTTSTAIGFALALRVGSTDGATENDITRLGATELATVSGESKYKDSQSGKDIYLSSPANIMYGGGYPASMANGANNGIRTRLTDSNKLDYETHLHEMLHQLITRPGEAEHALGGGLSIPAGNINTVNVDAALNDALKSVNPVRKVKK